jgi:hypothetical protein
LIQRVRIGTRITIDLDSVKARPEGDRSYKSYKLMEVNGEDVSGRGWRLREEWFGLLPPEEEKASSPPSPGFIYTPDPSQGAIEQATEQPLPPSKYVHNLIVQFGSPESRLDDKIRGGSTNLVAKLNSLAPYKLTQEQKAGLPSFENAKVISVERNSPGGPVDPGAVWGVREALQTLRAASKFGPTRLYLRGHGDPLPKTLGGWSPQEVWEFLSKCGIKGMKIDVISVTGCQLALSPDEMMKKMGPQWLETQKKTERNEKEAKQYGHRYRNRGEQVYQKPGPAGPEGKKASPRFLPGEWPTTWRTTRPYSGAPSTWTWQSQAGAKGSAAKRRAMQQAESSRT